MNERVAVNPGRVDWCGDNPGIYLKDDPAGEWLSLATYFRVTYSPHGPGKAMIVVGAPDEDAGHPRAPNLCITDNRALSDYLIAGFVSKFPSFRGKEGLGAMTTLDLEGHETRGSLETAYSEVVTGGGVRLEMTWAQIGKPFGVEVGPESAPTGAHDMYNLFFEAREASITVDGQALAGRAVDRLFFGRTMSTAFLALSETWVTPPS